MQEPTNKTREERLAELENAITTNMNNAGMNRSTDSVARDTQAYLDYGRVDEDGRGLIIWLFVHAKQKGLTFEGAGKLIGYGTAVVSRLFAGKYDGSMENVVDAIRGYKHLVSEREKMASERFIETSVWKKVKGVCDLAILRNAPVRIVGISQIGKTHSLLEYKRRATLNVFYCRIPAAPTFKNVVQTISEAVGVNASLRVDDLRRRVPGALNRQTLLIIDELHELTLSGGKGTAMKSMEWIRELYDRTNCGLVVCGTRAMEDDLIGGVGLKGWLDQFDQRCIRKLELPLRLPEEDIQIAAQAYGFPRFTDADGLDNFMSRIRMNRLCACLNMAATASVKNGVPRTWDLFKQTYRTVFGGVA